MSPHFWKDNLCVCVVCEHVHIHTITECGLLGCEPRCRDGTLGGPGRNPNVTAVPAYMYAVHVYEVPMNMNVLGCRY